MKILALDTSLGACSVALLDDGDVKARIYEERVRGHAERLVPMIQQVLEDSQCARSDLDYIAAAIGPGTFTGVRIGLATARGFAMTLAIPLVGITSLEALAWAVKEDVGDQAFAVCHDARRGEVYSQIFKFEENDLRSVKDPEAVPLSHYADWLNDDVKYVVGTGVDLIRDALEAAQTTVAQTIQQPDAAVIARLAQHKIINGDFQSDQRTSPLYLRAPDAVLPKPVIMPFQK